MIKFKSRTNFINYANGFIFLDNLRYLNISSTEARSSKLPSIGLVDVDVGFSPFVYSVPSNNKTFSIFFSFYCLFFRASEAGWFSWNVICGKFLDQQTRRVFSKLVYFSKINFLTRFSNFIKTYRRASSGYTKFDFFEQIQQSSRFNDFYSYQTQSYRWFLKYSNIRFDLLSCFNYGLQSRKNAFGFSWKKFNTPFKQRYKKILK